MKSPSSIRSLVHGALIAALYVAISALQNLLWPGSATMVIQFRVAEALCILALLTPAALPGLTLGCFLFNISWAQALPLDLVVGPLATALAAWSMRALGRRTFKKLPLLSLLMPGLCNGLLVGLELTLYLSPNGFSWGLWGLNGLCVFLEEGAVLLTLGLALYKALERIGGQ